VLPITSVSCLYIQPIITPNAGGFTLPFNELLQRPDNSTCRQGKIHLNRQGFTIKVIDDIQQTDGTTI